MDRTGRFPYKSSTGNEYIPIAYYVDLNIIIGTPAKNRQANTLEKPGYIYTTSFHNLSPHLTPGSYITNLWRPSIYHDKKQSSIPTCSAI